MVRSPPSHGVGPCSEGWLKSWLKSALGVLSTSNRKPPLRIPLRRVAEILTHPGQVEVVSPKRVNPTTPLYLALCLSSLAMAKIGPVITLLHPCDQR